MTIVEIVSISLSAIAIVVSAVSIYLQFMVEGPKVELLNTKDMQRKIARPHNELPEQTQKQYPYIPDALPGYALVTLVFGNSGDRAGLVSIKGLQVRIKNNPNPILKASYPTYILIPAYQIVEQEILLKNIQLGEYIDQTIEIQLTAEYGGYHPWTGKALKRGTFQDTLEVSIVRGDEDPDLTGFSYH